MKTQQGQAAVCVPVPYSSDKCSLRAGGKHGRKENGGGCFSGVDGQRRKSSSYYSPLSSLFSYSFPTRLLVHDSRQMRGTANEQHRKKMTTYCIFLKEIYFSIRW
jgi:hypothetical protein